MNKEIVAGSGEEIEPGENSGPKKAGKRADKIVFTKGFVSKSVSHLREVDWTKKRRIAMIDWLNIIAYLSMFQIIKILKESNTGVNAL